MSRWFWFLLAIAAGIAAGLGYGWYVNPVQYVNTSPDTLRFDYKADYVLMVAEAYHTEGDLARAVQRLGLLGYIDPAESVHQAVLNAERLRYTRSEQSGYTDVDLALMRALLNDLQTQFGGAPMTEPAPAVNSTPGGETLDATPALETSAP